VTNTNTDLLFFLVGATDCLPTSADSSAADSVYESFTLENEFLVEIFLR